MAIIGFGFGDVRNQTVRHEEVKIGQIIHDSRGFRHIIERIAPSLAGLSVINEGAIRPRPKMDFILFEMDGSLCVSPSEGNLFGTVLSSLFDHRGWNPHAISIGHDGIAFLE